MSGWRVVLLVALLCGGTAHAQRQSVAPDAFLEDADGIAGASRLGSALLALDAGRKSWGDYCSDSQALARQGEFRQAIRAATKALYLGQSQHGNHGAPIIYSMSDIANAYSYAGDHATAEAWATRTLEAAAKGYDSSVRLNVLGIRANAHRIRALARSQAGAHDAALAELDRGLDALPGFGMAAARAELEIVRALLLLRAGKADQAHRAAERLLRESDPLTRLGAGRVAGEAALAQGDAGSARVHFATALDAAAQRKDPYQTVMAQLGMVRVLRKLGDTDAAVRQLDQALSALEQLRSGFHSFEMRSALYGNLQSVFDEAVEFYASQGQAERALAASEAGRARAMLDLQGKVQGASRMPVGRPRSLAQIQAALNAEQRMVVYHQLPARLLAWTIAPARLEMHDLPVPAAVLQARVEALRRGIERSDASARALAQGLHAAILAPLQLPVGAPLVFVPHRSLHLLPFQALHDGSRWLIEGHAVATALSASLLAVRPFTSGDAALTALGNPDLGRPEWDLPGAEREVRALGQLYPRSQVFLRNDASKAQLVRTAGEADVVHVAAHAVIDEVDPMYSVIKLASLGGTPATGAAATDLQARELAALDLSRAQLISLSACSSGLGKVAQGDEFMGFKRALLAAGARSALVSLWIVDDDATEALMTSFHKAWRGTSRSEALRAAQLAVLRQPQFAHPFYWAPFTLVGDPG